MTPEQIIFIIIAALTFITAIKVVTSRNLIHSALWLIAALFGVAIFYVLLDAGFFAVLQVVIYIGAISILFIFAAMLTRRVMQDSGPQSNTHWWLGALISVLLLAGLTVVLLGWVAVTTDWPSQLSGTLVSGRL